MPVGQSPTLPATIVERDHKLETESTVSQEKLAQLRWHWTADESNPDRVSVLTYARSVGRAESIIRKNANGYAAYHAALVSGLPTSRSLGDEIEMALMGENKQAAAELIAAKLGLGLSNVTRHKRRQIKAAVEIATSVAERNHTTILDEIPNAVATVLQHDQDEADEKARIAASTTATFRKTEHGILAARRNLTKVLDLSRTADLADDPVIVAYLHRQLRQLRDLLDLLDLSLTGSIDIDWDRELAKLETA